MKNKLPKYIKSADLKSNYKKSLDTKTVSALWDRGADTHIKLWHVTGWGWCIPVLLIKSAGRRNPNVVDRNYAVMVESGELVRVGLGPHIDETVLVHVNKTNFKRLTPLIDVMIKGKVLAHQARDQRSTRALRRNLFGGF